MNNKEFIESITLEGEEWRNVIGWEGKYLISNNGRLIALAKKANLKTGNRITLPKLIKLQKDKKGYIVATLYHNNICKGVKIHRLVAESFISNPNKYPHIDHIDGTKDNNCVNNLRWVTRSMNMMNPITRKRNSCACKNRKGVLNPKSIQIVQIDSNGNVIIHESYRDITSKYGYTHKCIKKHCITKEKYKGSLWIILSDYETLINKSKNDLLSQ